MRRKHALFHAWYGAAAQVRGKDGITMNPESVLADYVAKIEKEWRTGNTTEHTYRGALADLFNALHPEFQTLNEPKRVACGAPDYIVMKSGLPLAFIEAKDIGDGDLDGRKANKEQFNRYKASLNNIAFTDYLDFHFYRNGESVGNVRIADVKGNRIVLDKANVAQFCMLVDGLVGGAVQNVKSARQLAQLMAGKARLLEQVTARMLSRKSADKTATEKLMDDFKRTLVPDVDAAGFADVYAQTLTYGMFAARLHDETPATFSRYEAAALIPKSNSFLKNFFTYIATDLEDEVAWVVDDLVTTFGAADVRTILKDYGKSTQQRDPMIHFYEDFLSFYDAGLRRERGVWYTPLPVVKFIVGAVDRILEKHFGLVDGLANRDKIEIEYETFADHGKPSVKKQKKTVHKVQVLDPATGTGTFLAECVNRVHEKFAGHEGKWQNYVAEDLLPRLNGFEILMASYTMAHVKLDFVLSNSGYTHKGGRFNVFLTNSLEESAKSIGPLFAAMLGEEANAAKFIKDNCPVMVVMGNPPYSGISRNNGKWITGLVNEYKREPGTTDKLNERKTWLNDDYVKFIRLAESYVERNREGIVAYINNNGLLDNPTFRGMRWHLLDCFDEIYVLNLHGNSMKHEKAPDGSKDENVFSITVGTTINIFVKTGKKKKGDLAFVRYAELYGLRKDKFAFLESHELDDVKFETVEPVAPYYFFVPTTRDSFTYTNEYDAGFRIDELMPLTSSGIVSMGDGFAYGDTKDEIKTRITDLLVTNYAASELKYKYGLGKNYADFILKFRQKAKVTENRFVKMAYRPFDEKWTYYHGDVLWRTRSNVMDHMFQKENIGLCVIRICSRDDSLPVFITTLITDKTILSSKDNANVFPLYLYQETMGKVEKVPNFKQEIYDRICEAVKGKPTPEEVFDYVYAVLHTPEYREKYKEFLKVDFPRIPYPKDAETFKELAACGETLRHTHLLHDKHSQFETTAAFPVPGNNVVEGVRWIDGRVYVNDTQYFDKVDAATFGFWIGGYQPAQKWLKDRKGKTLANADCDHYQSLVLALVKTQQIMTQLSELSKRWI